MRYLYSADGDRLLAYAPGRRDFFGAGDDRLWAHESHGWLIDADSGRTLAHRTGDVYYDAVDGERLYRISAEREPQSQAIEREGDRPSRPRRATRRVARPRDQGAGA